MLVVDTSAVIVALADAEHPAAEALATDGDLHAPHLLDVEFQHVLARMLRTGKLTAEASATLRGNFADLAISRYPHVPLADRMWKLRHNLTAYDASFVALAETLGVPLVTADQRLARAPAHRATVRVVAARTEGEADEPD